jgi:hypothetical protein
MIYYKLSAKSRAKHVQTAKSFIFYLFGH